MKITSLWLVSFCLTSYNSRSGLVYPPFWIEKNLVQKSTYQIKTKDISFFTFTKNQYFLSFINKMYKVIMGKITMLIYNRPKITWVTKMFNIMYLHQ